MTTANQTLREPRGKRGGRPVPGRALGAMRAGLALTVLGLVAVVLDQATTGVLGRHLATVYADYGPGAAGTSFLLSYLFTVGVLGMATWLGVSWALRRGKRWARAAATTAFLLGTAVAVLNLVMADAGHGTVLPLSYGIGGLLPSVAGFFAVLWLWRPVSGSA